MTPAFATDLPVNWFQRCAVVWHDASPPVDPERCRSDGDGHSAMRPHLASSSPAALASSAAVRRV